MNILVLGGTRYMGKHLVEDLLQHNHQVTIATRGKTQDNYGHKVHRIIVERTNETDLISKLAGRSFDIIFDNIAYCSNEVKWLLDVVQCKKYIMISTTSVYNKHYDTKESDYDATSQDLIWCDRFYSTYDSVKRQAENALFQHYEHISFIAVRYPFVIGKDDYTNRLYFYVEHIIKQLPMCIDNMDNQMSFISSKEAGHFLSFLMNVNYHGAINGSNDGTISIRDICDYVLSRTGISPILTDIGHAAPYNGENEYSINMDKAKSLGFTFTPLRQWIYDLIDYYIDKSKHFNYKH